LNSPAGVARVLIVDDHPVVRDGLGMRIGGQQDMRICGEAEDVDEAMKLVIEQEPDVVIIDIALKSGSGIDLMKRIRLHGGGIRMLGMSMYDDNLYAERSVRAGAMGYISKQQATRDVINAIRQVLAGNMYLSDGVADRILHLARGGPEQISESPIDRLSDRELEVFRLIGQGCSTREVAEHLQLSPKTVENYRENVKTKLGLKDSNALIRQATIWTIETGNLS
jgi:DNA-binding NarL/FixJ family response regulator